MKIKLKRITGIWCLEYDCWPQDHPGCESRDEKDCYGCPKSIKKIIIGKIDGSDNLSGESVQ